MHAWLPLLLWLAPPFWQTMPPEKWSDRQIDEMLHSSPWAQIVGPAPAVLVYLATAAPVEEAEMEMRVRLKRSARPVDPDYASYLSENRERQFVLAIPYSVAPSGRAVEQRRLEEETVMVIGKRQFRFAGYFPPTPSDPVLRLVFPREVRPGDVKVIFRLYLPDLSFPEREVEFAVKDLFYRGKFEM